MKVLALLLLTPLATLLAAQESAPKPCVILKRSSAADHAITGIEFYFVAGRYPKGYKFRTNLRGRHARQLQKMGGRMAILESRYTADDLAQAQKTCEVQP